MEMKFYKGCQDNCLLGVLEQNFSNKNMPEENIIYKIYEYTNNKTSTSILYKHDQINENNYEININLNSAKVLTNIT